MKNSLNKANSFLISSSISGLIGYTIISGLIASASRIPQGILLMDIQLWLGLLVTVLITFEIGKILYAYLLKSQS